MQQEAEIKRLRADANARVREAQLRGMAATAAAAREQAAGLFNRVDTTRDSAEQHDADSSGPAASQAHSIDDEQERESSNVVQLPTHTLSREYASERMPATMMNHAVSTSAMSAHQAPATATRAGMAQPSLIADGASSTLAPRRPPTLDGSSPSQDSGEIEAMTGTTGPRPAVRPASQSSTLLRGMNEPHPSYVQAVMDASNAIRASGRK